jgi:hypothetical protein
VDIYKRLQGYKPITKLILFSIFFGLIEPFLQTLDIILVSCLAVGPKGVVSLFQDNERPEVLSKAAEESVCQYYQRNRSSARC